MQTATSRPDSTPGAILDAPDHVMTHRVVINAPADAIYASLTDLRLGDLPLAGVLFAIRRLPALVLGKTPVTIALDRTLIDAFRAEGFMVLGERPPHEIVLGVVGRFWELTSGVVRLADASAFQVFDGPGHAKAYVAFRIEPAGPGRCEVVTETAIQALDAGARWRFRAYWTLVRLGSGLIRWEMLRALKRRAEERTAGATRGPDPRLA